MTTYKPDGLFAFGNSETVEVPFNNGRPDTANDSTQKAPLGTLYRFKGNLFRYVLFNSGTDAVAAAQYGVAHWLLAGLDPSVGLFTVTSDYSSGLAGVNGVAGILGGIITTGNYTWIQVGGLSTVKCAVSFVAGDVAIGGSSDLTFNRLAADASITSLGYGTATASRDGSGNDKFLLEAHRLASF